MIPREGRTLCLPERLSLGPKPAPPCRCPSPPPPQPLTAAQRDVAVQCFALRLLSDFTLMYQHCVGVLLKRDTDLATKEVGGVCVCVCV